MDSHNDGWQAQDLSLAPASSTTNITSHIDKLPPEILHDILRRVRNSSNKSQLPAFAALQTVCRRWHDLAKPILWSDVVLDNNTLPLFLSKEYNEKYTMVRSLTVRGTVASEIETLYLASNIAISFLGNVYELSKILPDLTRLERFSLILHDFPVTGVRRTRFKQICSLLDRLPKSCTAIEIDAAGKDGRLMTIHHICESIQKILPRMKHIRLNVGTMCECMFLKDQGAPLTASHDATEYTVAPMLETLIILVHYPLHCKLTSYDCPTTLPLPDLPEIVQAVESPLRAGAFPKATKISVFHWGPFGGRNIFERYHKNDKLKSWEILEYDVANNLRVGMPYLGVRKLSGYDGYDMMSYRVGTKSKTVFGNERALVTVAEGRAWDTTVYGSRLPGYFARSKDAQEKGYGFEDSAMDLFDQGEKLRANTMHFRDKETGELRSRFKRETEMSKQMLSVKVMERNTGKEYVIPVGS